MEKNTGKWKENAVNVTIFVLYFVVYVTSRT